jgi:hypothetical protein
MRRADSAAPPTTLDLVDATVDRDVGAGGEAAEVRGQEHDGLGHLVGFCHPGKRNRILL